MTDSPFMNQPTERRRQVVQGSVWTMVHAATATPIGVIATLLIARALGPGSFGHLAVLTLALSLASTVTQLNWAEATIRWGAAAVGRGEPRELGPLMARSLGFHACIQLPLLLLVILALQQGLIPTLLCAFGTTCVTLLGGSIILLTIEGRTAVGAKVAMFSNTVTQAVTVAVALATGSASSTWGARVAVTGALVSVNVLVARRGRSTSVFRMAWPFPAPSGFVRYSSLNTLAGLLSLLVFSRTEVVALDWLSTPEDVGAYALAAGIAVQLGGPLDALLNPLGPAVSGRLAQDPASTGGAFLLATRYSGMLSALMLAAAVPGVALLIPVLYGDAFAAAQALFLPLAAATLIRAAAGPLLAFRQGRLRAGQTVVIFLIAATIDAAVAFALAKPLGATGATVASCIGQAVGLGLLVRSELIEQQVSLRSYWRQLRPLWLSACAASIVTTLGLLAAPTSAEGRVLSAVTAAVLSLVGFRVLNGLWGSRLGAADMNLFYSAGRLTTLAARHAGWFLGREVRRDSEHH